MFLENCLEGKSHSISSTITTRGAILSTALQLKAESSHKRGMCVAPKNNFLPPTKAVGGASRGVSLAFSNFIG